MTLETCERMKQNCLKHGDEAGAAYYQERIDRKIKKYPKYQEKTNAKK